MAKNNRKQAKRKQLSVWLISGGTVLLAGIVFISVSLVSRLGKPADGSAETGNKGISVSEEAYAAGNTPDDETERESAGDDRTQETEAVSEEAFTGADETNSAAGEAGAEIVLADPALAEEVKLREEGTSSTLPEGETTDPDAVTVPLVQPVYMQGFNDEVLSTVKLLAVGDNLLHLDVQYSTSRDDITFDFEKLFTYTRDRIAAADIAVINQEAVVGGDQYGIRGYPSFNAITPCVAALRNVGFDVVLGANNHILDMGVGAVHHMVQFFRQNYPELKLLGIHDSWETRDEINVIECNGIRIGMINYTDLSNNMYDYRGNEYVLDMLDYDRLASLIQQTKAASDFVIVFPHWGTEYERNKDQKQIDETAFLAEQGVDLVIGTHPHVVEPIEYVDRPDGGRMLVYYSLGNYISFQRPEATLLGGMAKVTLEKTSRGVRIGDFDMEILATEYHYPPPPDDWRLVFNTYPFSMFTREIAAQGDGVLGWGEPFSIDYMFALGEQLQQMVRDARHAEGLE